MNEPSLFDVRSLDINRYIKVKFDVWNLFASMRVKIKQNIILIRKNFETLVSFVLINEQCYKFSRDLLKDTLWRETR